MAWRHWDAERGVFWTSGLLPVFRDAGSREAAGRLSFVSEALSTQEPPRPQHLRAVHVTSLWRGPFSGPTLTRFGCAGWRRSGLASLGAAAGSDRCRALDDSKRRVLAAGLAAAMLATYAMRCDAMLCYATASLLGRHAWPVYEQHSTVDGRRRSRAREAAAGWSMFP